MTKNIKKVLYGVAIVSGLSLTVCGAYYSCKSLTTKAKITSMQYWDNNICSTKDVTKAEITDSGVLLTYADGTGYFIEFAK